MAIQIPHVTLNNGVQMPIPERMAQNLEVFDFELTEDEMDHSAALDTGASLFFDHRDPNMVSWLGARRLD